MKAPPEIRAYILMEYLIYMGVLTVVLTLGFSALHHSREGYLALKRNTDDIVRALQAGERWRADVRAADGEPERVDGGLQLERKAGVVTYRFAVGTIWREAGSEKTPFLKGVKSSRMFLDARQHARVWRWEVELASPQKVVRVRPLFTFQATKTVTP